LLHGIEIGQRARFNVSVNRLRPPLPLRRSFYGPFHFCALLLTLFVSNSSAACPVNGLLGYWPLNGSAADASDCGNDGFVSGAVGTVGYDGSSNGAYEFDGSNDAIGLGTSHVLDPPLPITFSFLIRHDCLGKRCQIFMNDPSSNYVGIGISLLASGVIDAFYGDGGTPSPLNRRSASSSVILSPGVWYHVAVVIVGPTDFRFYFDGVQESPGSISYSGTGGALAYDHLSALIGLDTVSNYPFDGDIDDVRFYNRILTASEIEGFNPASCVGVDGLRGHWPISGNAEDLTPCKNHGTAFGASLTPDFTGNPVGAYHLDGSEINMGRSSVLKPELPITVSMLVNHSCLISTGCVLFENDSDTGTSYSGVTVLLTGGFGLYAQYGDGGNASSVTRRSASVPSFVSGGSWHHIAVVFVSSSDFRFYLDGVQFDPGDVNYDGSGDPLLYEREPMRIGQAGSLGGSFAAYTGDVDDIRIYDKALTSGEIAELNFLSCVGANGLLGYWPMDGDATDATDCQNHGTANGATLTTDRDAASNMAYDFDGVDDSITLGDSPVLKPPLPLSVTMWVRSDCPTGSCDLIYFDPAGGVYTGVRIYISNGVVGITYGDGGTATSAHRRTAFATNAFTPGVWQHLAVVVQGPTNMQIYIDGVAEPVTYSGSGGSLAYLGGTVFVGLGGSWHDGGIDELRIYNRALSAPEVVNVANDDFDGDGLDIEAEQAIGTNPEYADTDADGRCDGSIPVPPCVANDNCPNVSNGLQENNDAFQAGDACQCGNVDEVGGIDATDLLRAREYVVGRTGPPLPGLEKFCDVNDDQACDVEDLYIIDRASHGASATILDRCDVYLGQ